VRMWTMNTQEYWLFSRADSCGALIETDINRDPNPKYGAGVFPREDALSAVAGDKNYFWSKDPGEKDTVLSRMRKHKTRGIIEADFYQYKHILCFDEQTRKRIEDLKAAVVTSGKKKVVSQVRLLKSCDWYRDKMGSNREDLSRLFGNVRT